ncbi:hypothetical protein AJ87_35355 [Rhizobium yanglingense]|nr:hypothetical protein AJ87_35355 [Rhizobium yanglingense]
MTCIRNKTTIDDVGFERERHADRFLKAPEEMHRLFAEYPEALARTREIADRCRFDLSELEYQYPEEAIVPGLDAQQSLTKFAWEGAAERYPEGIPEKVRRAVQHELELIRAMKYAPYFLTVYSIVRSPVQRAFSVRAGDRRQTRLSAIASASRRSTRKPMISCSSDL